jgi:hypothetical protein
MWGLLASAMILMLVFAGIALVASTSFEGECISFEPPSQSCSLGRYLVQAVVLTVLAAPWTHTSLFILAVAILVGLPIAGLVVGIFRARTATRT